MIAGRVAVVSALGLISSGLILPALRYRHAVTNRRQFASLGLAAATTAIGGGPTPRSDTEVATEISARVVSSAVNNQEWVLVDTRTTDAYNGWKLDGVKRGGHLPGAVDFPASWLDSDHDARAEILSTALRVKGIEPQRRILLYGTNKRDRNRVAAYLRGAGFPHLYDFDLNSWADDPTKPLVRYENFHLLVPPSIVKQLLDGHWPETFEPGKPTKFVEVSWGGEDVSYSKGHVPRSFHVNTDHFEPPPEWMLGNADVLGRFAKQYGFQADDTIIVSGEDPTASYRLAIVLRYMGVRDIRVLNGGFAAWKAAKYRVETKRNPPPIASSFGTPIPSRAHLIDDITRVKTGLRTPAEFTLVDTRTWAEFTGETSGYKYHSRKGRIPGSLFGQADFKGPNSLTPYRNIDNTMRNAGEIRGLWKESGIDTEKHLSFMCGSGWRAAEVLTFAQVMGLSNTSLYSDGWIRWSNDPRNPVESGRVTAATDNR
jgi:thiosulfate/3-mercaptopyruvate sulfurtransferase